MSLHLVYYVIFPKKGILFNIYWQSDGDTGQQEQQVREQVEAESF